MSEYRTPYITVIIPFWNVEDYLSRSVSSVLAQTFLDFELILVDDGSGDNSGMIADRFAEQHPNIRVSHHEHHGVSCARNAGLDAACGEYIHFMDSDDYIAPEMYEVLTGIVKVYDADIAACRIVDVYRNRQLSGSGNGTVTVLSPYEALEQIMTRKTDDSLCSKLIRRTLFRDLRFEQGRNYEDVRIMPELFMRADRIVDVNENLYYYYHRLYSVTTTPDPERCTDIIEACDLLVQKMPESLHDAAVFRSLSSRFGVLDLILMEGNPADYPFFPGLVRYLIEHRKDVLHNPHFRKERRFAAIMLSFSLRLYTLLISMKWRMKQYYK